MYGSWYQKLPGRGNVATSRETWPSFSNYLRASCDNMSLGFAEFKAQTANLPKSPAKIKVHAILPVIVVFLVTTYATVGLRFYTRRKYGKLWWDDWLMLTALVSIQVTQHVINATDLSSSSSRYFAVAQLACLLCRVAHLEYSRSRLIAR